MKQSALSNQQSARQPVKSELVAVVKPAFSLG
jgi:hypothetical protein